MTSAGYAMLIPALTNAVLNNFTLRMIRGCGSVIIGEALMHRARIAHVRFVVKLRALCMKERARSGEAGEIMPWLASRAPHWVVVRVCALLPSDIM